jgi:pimeloyl-ACP methyl ester carboxylesterase
LLPGWPDDATTWNEVYPSLNDAGFRTIVPMARGFGATRFLSTSTPRTGNTAILAIDAIELLDALGIENVCVGSRLGYKYRGNVGSYTGLDQCQAEVCHSEGDWTLHWRRRIADLSAPLAEPS